MRGSCVGRSWEGIVSIAGCEGIPESQELSPVCLFSLLLCMWNNSDCRFEWCSVGETLSQRELSNPSLCKVLSWWSGANSPLIWRSLALSQLCPSPVPALQLPPWAVPGWVLVTELWGRRCRVGLFSLEERRVWRGP